MKNKTLILIISFLSSLSSFDADSQVVKPVNDVQKRKQIESMELTRWDFAPDYYYYITKYHKDYSGARWHTEWKPWPVFSIRFDESKSNTKRCAPVRATASASELIVSKKTQLQLDSIKPIFMEETLRSADRNIDLAYELFREDFQELQTNITDNLKYSLQRSNGKLSKTVSALADQNNLICDKISYTHKSGPGYELENTKRELIYEEALQQMKELAIVTCRLALYTTNYYSKD